MKFYKIILLASIFLLTACSSPETQGVNEPQGVPQNSHAITEKQEDSQSSFQLYKDARTSPLWIGKTMALVEHCSSDFLDPPEGVPLLPYCDDEAYLDFQLQDGSYVGIDPKASEYYLFSALSPSGSQDSEYTFTPDEKYWIYTDTWSSDQPTYVAHNITTGEDEILFSLLAPASSTNCYGQSFIDSDSKGWNPSKTKLGIIASNGGAESYPTETKVFILTIADGKIVTKNKYNIPVSYSCPNDPLYRISWLDDDTLRYFSSEEVEDGYFFDDFYYESGWETEWTRFYDVK